MTKRFGALTAVDAVSLKVRKGEFLSLLGPSGCGKTTSLRLIAGFEQPDEGEILIGGTDAVGTPPYRRDVNTVFQQYALFLWVPRSSSTSRDQAVFVDQATDASLSSDPVLPEIDRFG